RDLRHSGAAVRASARINSTDGVQGTHLTMVVESGPRGQWVVSRVEGDSGSVTHRQLVEAAPLRDPSIRCIQRLGGRLITEVGEASRILFLLDSLATQDRLTPQLLASFPVPILSASPSVALAHAVPAALTRFALIDFAGRGSVSLVKRARDGHISDFL